MLKKISAFLPLGVVLALAFSVNAFAVDGAAAGSGEKGAIALVVVILSLGVIVAFTVKNVMKRKRAK